MSIKLGLKNQAEFSLYGDMPVQTEQTKVGSGFRQFVQAQSPKWGLPYHKAACAFSLLSLYRPKNKLSKLQFVSLYTPYRVYKLNKLKLREQKGS